MKKILFVLAFVLTVSVANAWNKMADEGVVVLASKHLSGEAKSMLTNYLGESYADDVQYLTILERKNVAGFTKEIHYLHLDKELQPVKVEGDDALVAIEQALAVVRDRKSHSTGEVRKSLRTLINLMCDIHHLSNVRIEGIPHSQGDFSFLVYAGDVGKRKATSPIKWSNFWSSYSNWHKGFSGNLWAEDIDVCLGAEREELSKGSLRDWATQIGSQAVKMYAHINSDYVMTKRERNELEVLNYEMMARAGYRLAVLLNDVVK